MAISIVQQKADKSTSAGATSLTLTLASTPTVGNTLICAISCDAFPSMTGWTQDQSTADASALRIFRRTVQSGDGTGVAAITWGSNTSGCSANVYEVSGLDTNPLDQTTTNGNGGSSTTTLASGTVTTTVADEFIIVASSMDVDTQVYSGWDSGFTTDVTDQKSTNATGHNVNFSCASKIVSATGSQSSTVSWDFGTSRVIAAIATYKIAGPAPGGILSVGQVGTAADTTSGATTTVTASGGAVNDLLVAWVSVDNSGTSGAAPGLTVTDARSNTWTVESVSLNDPGAASAGSACYIAWSVLSTALQTNDLITFTWGSGNPAAKAIYVHEFSGAAPGVVAHAETQVSGTTPTATLTAVPMGYLVCGAVSVEGGTGDTFTQDSDTTNGSWNGISRQGAGSGTTGATINGAWKVVTAAGDQTYNPILGTSRDAAEKMVSFGLAQPWRTALVAPSGAAHRAANW